MRRSEEREGVRGGSEEREGGREGVEEIRM